MNRRLTDVICLGVIGIVALVAFLTAHFEGKPERYGPLPDFALPDVSLEMSFDLPYRFVRFRRPPPPRLRIPANTEAALVAVREALLESATVVEDPTPEPRALVVAGPEPAHVAAIAR